MLPVFLNLAKVLKTEDLLLDDQEKISLEFEGLVLDLAVDLILSSLTDDDARKFLSLLENTQENPTGALTFAKEKIPDLEKKLGEKIKKEIENLRK